TLTPARCRVARPALRRAGYFCAATGCGPVRLIDNCLSSSRRLSMHRIPRALALLLSGVLLLGSDHSSAQAQEASRFFPETGHSVRGRFLDYWNSHGGLAQQGYPISDEIQEVSPTDGNTYTVQYFERAVFEYHPEKQAPYDVLLSLLGVL